jgi:uncharacterized protein (TIGR02996 family)
MHDEADFLSKLLESPEDDTARLVYADWLEERGDAESKLKVQFLRLTVRLNETRRRSKMRTALRNELQPLAAKLPTEWLAIVSRLPIDYCGDKVPADHREAWVRRQFDFVCNQEWDEMTPTGDAAVRHCERCKENVHYCDTITVAREHARQGHCVAVDLGIIRRDNDLAPRTMVRGKIMPGFSKQEDERLAVDAMSLEREEQKRKS